MQVYWSTIKGTDKAESEDRVLVGQRISFEETSPRFTRLIPDIFSTPCIYFLHIL